MKTTKTDTPQAHAKLRKQQLEQRVEKQSDPARVEVPAIAIQETPSSDPATHAIVQAIHDRRIDPTVLARRDSQVSPAVLQAITLRGGKPTTPPKTTGAQMTMFGAEVASLGKSVRELLTPKVSAVALAIMLCTAGMNDLPAQTVYVNVNGATAQTAEVVGARRAATAANEPFHMVKPDGLPGVLAQANEPNGKLRRLMVSGHSGGLAVSGSDAQGSYNLSIEDMKRHAAEYPHAFGRVQSFFAMACNIGTEENSRQWFALFPNLKALVGFDNIGPASDRPAAGNVAELVDAELRKVDFSKLTRDGAMQLARRLSQLPGVNVTEFAIRLRANDGSTVYFSKKNKPTSVSIAGDLASQLRTTGFTPWLEAASPQFARPPSDHGARNPIRAFYNATQTLLNAMGREITARGADPAQDWQYQRVTAEKEAALRLIYFDTVLQNVEHHMRPQLDALTRELARSGVALEIPKLTQLTRTEVLALQQRIASLGNYHYTDFAKRFAADIELVNAFAQAQGTATLSLTTVDPQLAEWGAQRFSEQLVELAKLPAANDELRAAAERMRAVLDARPSADYQAVQRIFTDGLKELKVEALPQDWVTTERPRV